MNKPVFNPKPLAINSLTNKQLLSEIGQTIYELKKAWGMKANEIYAHLNQIKNDEVKQKNIKTERDNEKLRKKYIKELAIWFQYQDDILTYFNKLRVDNGKEKFITKIIKRGKNKGGGNNDIKQFQNLLGKPEDKTTQILYEVKNDIIKISPDFGLLQDFVLNTDIIDFVVSYIWDGSLIKTQTYHKTSSFQEEWNERLRWAWVKDTNGITIFDDYDNETFPSAVYIYQPDTSITNDAIIQLYRDGNSHCVLNPMLKWATDLRDKKDMKNCSKKRYNAIINKVNKYLIKFDKGIPPEELENVCNDLNIKVNISFPFLKKIMSYGDKLKNPLKVFNATNTRLNHIEMNLSFDLNAKVVAVSKNEMIELFKNAEHNKTLQYWTKSIDGLNKICVDGITYGILQEEHQLFHKFKLDNGFYDIMLDDLKEIELTKFIKNGTHYNGSIHFINPDGMNNTNMECCDQTKAYANFKKCKYYDGFLGKITDFRQTTETHGNGLYYITNLTFTNNAFKIWNDKLQMYIDNTVYTLPDLKCLDDNGVKYDILYGAYGVEDFEFEFNQEMLNKTSDAGSLYSRFVGSLDSHNHITTISIYANKEFHDILYQEQPDMIRYFANGELTINLPKEKVSHAGHITAYILAYQRCSLIEQLLLMKPEKVYKIHTDGIYFEKDYIFELKDTFRIKDFNQNGYLCSSSNTFLSRMGEDNSIWKCIVNDENIIGYKNINEWSENVIAVASSRDNYKTELFLGAGGCGKSYYNLMDKGLVKVLYVAPSYKLCADVKHKYGTNTEVLSNLLSDVEYKTQSYNKYNTIIFDEVSQYTNNNKLELMKRYSSHKLIFLGDIGFQLGACSEDEPITLDNFTHIEEFTNNRRAKCSELKELLLWLRQNIKSNHQDVIQYCSNIIQSITVPKLQEIYKVNDIVLSGTNNMKDKYTELLKGDKYIITKRNEMFNRGDIVFTKPNATYELRHGYTVHSIQGETFKENIFIDITTMITNKLVYTAISRAEYLSQIYLI